MRAYMLSMMIVTLMTKTRTKSSTLIARMAAILKILVSLSTKMTRCTFVQGAAMEQSASLQMVASIVGGQNLGGGIGELLVQMAGMV